MDVICDRCRAEYEFDESLLGERGTTVKCSACGHVFRVVPPKRDSARPALKLRLTRTGQVETIASLRDLQKRIHTGEITVEDQLGREGFPWRRLGEVPELKNFFAARRAATGTPRPSGPSPATGLGADNQSLAPSNTNHGMAAADTGHPIAERPSGENKASHSSGPPTMTRSGLSGKRTVLGLGPDSPKIPPAPRVPQVAVPTSQATSPSNGRSNGVSEHARPASPASPSMPVADESWERAPISNAPTKPGVVPAPAGLAPTEPGAFPSEPAQRAPALSSRPPAVASATAPTVPSVFPSNPVKLYLSDDEAPPARATDGPRIWLYALMVIVLAGGGWLAMNIVERGKQKAAEPALGEAPRVETGATPTAAVPEAPAEPSPVPAPGPDAPAAAPAPADPVAPAAAAPVPSAPATGEADQVAAEPAHDDDARPTSSSKGAKGSASAGRSEPSVAAAGAASSASAVGKDKEPKDYGSWVAHGDQAFSRGQREAAKTAYENALALRPTGAEANTGMGQTLLADGKARDAIAYLDRASSSGYVDAYIGLGDAYRKLGQKSSAVESYEAYLERLPKGSRASYVRAQLASLGAAGAEGNAGGSPEPPKSEEPAAPPSDYRPAGELEAPAGPSAESP